MRTKRFRGQYVVNSRAVVALATADLGVPARESVLLRWMKVSEHVDEQARVGAA